jgi:hypothetical protein
MRSRTTLFLSGAILAALMIPLSEADIVYVPWVVAITYLVLFALSVLDNRSRTRRDELNLRRRPPPEPRRPEHGGPEPGPPR